MNDYPEIRASLVKFARVADRPAALKAHAEVLITIIDNMAKEPNDALLQAQFVDAYRRFQRAAEGEPLPANLSPAEIAKRLGLGIDPSDLQ